MLLEKGKANVDPDKNNKKLENKIGEQDKLTGKHVPKPATLQNSFGALQSEDDDDDDDDKDDDRDDTRSTTWREVKSKANLNRKQRRKMKLMNASAYSDDDEAVQSVGGEIVSRHDDHTTTIGCRHDYYTTTTTTTQPRPQRMTMMTRSHTQCKHNNCGNKNVCCEKDVVGDSTDDHTWLKSLARRNTTTSSSQSPDFPFVLHRQTSQCRRQNFQSSAGLSAVSGPSCERVPHEWQACGGDARGLETPRHGPPMPKLQGHDGQWNIPPLVSRAQGVPRGARCTRRTCRLGAPSTGTGPSPVIVAGDPCGLHSAAPQAQSDTVSQGKPHAQRCGGHGRANHDPPVVAATQSTVEPTFSGWTPVRGCDGVRRIEVQNSIVPSEKQAADGEGWKLKTPTRTLVDSGIAIGRSPVKPARGACISVSKLSSAIRSSKAKPSSNKCALVDPSSSNMCALVDGCPDGYKVHMKEADEQKVDEHEGLRWSQKILDKRVPKIEVDEKKVDEQKDGAKARQTLRFDLSCPREVDWKRLESANKRANNTQNINKPLRVHAGPPIFWSLYKIGNAAAHTQQIQRKSEKDQQVPLARLV